MSVIRGKSISLTFRGFKIAPSELELLVGKKSSSSGKMGEKRKPGISAVFPRSFVKFSVELSEDCRLDEMVHMLLSSIGGLAHICQIRDQVQPEFLEIDIVLPIKGSAEQDDGFISMEALTDVCVLKATLGFSFLWKEGFSDRVLKFLDGS
jgi:hypothetical protein